MKIILTTILLIATIHCFSQDVIELKDGRELEVEIESITPFYIHYFEIGDEDMIKYRMGRALIEKIDFDKTKQIDFNNYAAPVFKKYLYRKRNNVYYAGDQRVGAFSYLGDYIGLDPIAQDLFNKSQRNRKTANILGGISILSFATGTLMVSDGSADLGQVILGILIIVGITPATGTIGIISKINSNKKRKLLENHLQMQYGFIDLKPMFQDEIPDMHIGLVSSGVGLRLNF